MVEQTASANMSRHSQRHSEPINWRICKLFHSLADSVCAVISNNSLWRKRLHNKTFAESIRNGFFMEPLRVVLQYWTVLYPSVFYYAKGFNLHNAWYLGENEINWKSGSSLYLRLELFSHGDMRAVIVNYLELFNR